MLFYDCINLYIKSNLKERCSQDNRSVEYLCFCSNARTLHFHSFLLIFSVFTEQLPNSQSINYTRPKALRISVCIFRTEVSIFLDYREVVSNKYLIKFNGKEALSCLYTKSWKRQLHMASKRTELIKFLVLTYYWCEKKEPVSLQEIIWSQELPITKNSIPLPFYSQYLLWSFLSTSKFLYQSKVFILIDLLQLFWNIVNRITILLPPAQHRDWQNCGTAGV